MTASILILAIGASLLVAITLALVHVGVMKWRSRLDEQRDLALLDRLAQVLTSKGFSPPKRFQIQLGLGTRTATFTSPHVHVDVVIDEPKGEMRLQERRPNESSPQVAVVISASLRAGQMGASYPEAVERVVVAAGSISARSLTRA